MYKNFGGTNPKGFKSFSFHFDVKFEAESNQLKWNVLEFIILSMHLEIHTPWWRFNLKTETFNVCKN